MTYDEIYQAIVTDCPAVLSHCVLDHNEGERRPASPPVIAKKDEYPRFKKKHRLEGVYSLSLEEVEELSLATRARLLRLKPEGESGWSADFNNMHVIKAEDLTAAIFAAAAHLRREGDRSKGGLNITGAYIDGTVDLSNARLPFSVRLIGCVIDGALRLGRADLITLDLSSSALRGVHGTFLRVRGSLRMRRLTSTGVIDLGGLRVADVFDASDLLVFPWDDPPEPEAFVGDRGIVNLSLATLSNEARLIRARIYGGLTMKGATIERSLFLDDAILRAPIAYLERVGADVAMRNHRFERLPLAVRTAARAEWKLARELHGDFHAKSDERSAEGAERESERASAQDERRRRKADRRRRLCRFETLEELDLADPFRERGRDRLIRKLLGESVRARTSCLRADGLSIRGSIFARSIRSSGRVRLKYARIGGSLHLDGARMRSAQDIGEGLQSVEAVLKDLEEWRPEQRRTYAKALQAILAKSTKHAAKLEKSEGIDFALDIREINVNGHVHLTPDNRIGKSHDLDDALREAVDDALDAAYPNSGKAILKFWRAAKDPHVHAAYANGQIAMEGAIVNGDFELNGMLANLHNVVARSRSWTRDGKKGPYFLLMEQATIRGEVDLRGAIGIHGISAQHLVVNSRIRFASHSVREHTMERPALLLGGTLQFSDSRIGGDATLIFHREHGPNLLLARSHIEGRLHILPSHTFEIEGEATITEHTDRRKLSGKVPERVDEESLPEIDLRSARAAEFGHSELAWPHSNRLQIEGFIYEQTTSYGPLAPRARVVPKDVELKNWYFWVAFAASLLAATLAVVAVFMWRGKQIDAAFGLLNITVLLLMSGLIIVQKVIARLSEPTRVRAAPRAIRYLGLQKASQSVDQWRGLTIPLQPYAQAGRALRSAGQIIAANTLEVDRLRRRRQQLSWRNNWYTRVLLKLADSVTKYGFDPMRTLGIAILCGAFFACCFHAADRAGYIRPIDGDLMQAVPSSALRSADGERLQESPDTEEEPVAANEPGAEANVFASASSRREAVLGPASRVTAYPTFSSLIYALDVMAPGLDLGQEEYWRPMESAQEGYAPSNWAWLYASSAPMLKIIGWLLATAIAISILTRIEALIARNEE